MDEWPTMFYREKFTAPSQLEEWKFELRMQAQNQCIALLIDFTNETTGVDRLPGHTGTQEILLSLVHFPKGLVPKSQTPRTILAEIRKAASHSSWSSRYDSTAS